MPKIINNREECIECGLCWTTCPSYWERDGEDGRAKLRSVSLDKYEDGVYVLELSELGCNKDFQCPTNAIKVEE